VLEVGGEPRRYTTAPEPQTIDGETYRPGVDIKGAQVFALGQTTATITDAATDWVSILLGYSGPPVWAASVSWYPGTGDTVYPLQVGLATADAAGRPVYALTVSIDSSQAAGVRLYPDPALAIQPDSYPVRVSDTGADFAQQVPSVGAMTPVIYGIPGTDARGLYAGQAIGGPATPAYLAETGVGAPAALQGTIEVAIGEVAASTVRVHNMSYGYRKRGDPRGGTHFANLPVEYRVDGLGRSRSVVIVDADVVRADFYCVEDGEYWAEWLVDYGGGRPDPRTGAAMRRASLILPDLLEQCGYPVDAGRWGTLDGVLLDFCITESVDAVDWITQHLGSLPCSVYRSGAGFFARLDPLDSTEAGLTVRLGSEAAIGDALSWSAPSTTAAEVVVSFAPIQGATARSVRLTATGAESDARASVLCALAAARGLSSVASVSLPSVYDVATANRLADLVALDRCTAGPYATITTGDEDLMTALLLLGPGAVLTLDESDDLAPLGLDGRRCFVQSMTCTPAGLTVSVRVLREADR
jgi:hypothetical protein